MKRRKAALAKKTRRVITYSGGKRNVRPKTTPKPKPVEQPVPSSSLSSSPSIKKYFSYIHIPKTGGVSVKNALYPSCFINNKDITGGHLLAKERVNEKHWKESFKFTFVRNPWDQVISAYFFRTKNIHQKKIKLSFEQWIRKASEDPSILSPVIRKLFKNGQRGWITNDQDKIIVDFVGKFENLSDDWKHICQQIGLEKELKLYNSSQHQHYSYYYTEETRKIVAAIFQKDIEMFNYTFEDLTIKPKNKNFLYMTQTESTIPENYRHLISTDQSDLLCLSWKTPDPKAQQLNPNMKALYLPNSTWTEGRNRLIYEARNLKQTYLYYILMDDDLEFHNGSFKEYEEFLLKYMPAIGNPRIWFHNRHCEKLDMETHTLYSYDAALNGFHRDLFFDDTIFPYIWKFDHKSWWYSQLILIHLAAPFYRSHTLQHNPCQIKNDSHRPYPRDNKFAEIEEYIIKHLLHPDVKLLPHPYKSTRIKVQPSIAALESYRIDSETKKKCLCDYKRKCIVITTINPPTAPIQRMLLYSYDVIIVGDLKTPEQTYRDLADKHSNLIYLGTEEQKELYPELSELISYNHYARKNLGYLYAIQHQYDLIGEMDDDTTPYGNWGEMNEFNRIKNKNQAMVVVSPKYPNIYNLYTDKKIWPRGYPLDLVGQQEQPISIPYKNQKALAYQGLVDDDPDVDAICRLTCPDFTKDFKFDQKDYMYYLNKGILSPGNTQNIIWTRSDALIYMYVPSTVSFRYCDILRSYISQYGFWSLDGYLAITGATATQDRNDHDLYQDFKSEIPVYLDLNRTLEALKGLKFAGDPKKDLLMVYQKLHQEEIVKDHELKIVEAWIKLFK